MTTSVVPIVSGGLDSVTMAYHVYAMDVVVDSLVSFDYRQRHVKELESAKRCAFDLGVPHAVIDLQAVLGSTVSALTSGNVAVPDGHYAEESMQATIVPGRNLLMIAAATAYAIGRGAKAVAIGVHGGDHFIYPDCRQGFVNAAADAIQAGYGVDLWAPFITWTKADIARRSSELLVPTGHTWSCYKGGSVHCGTCGTCVERREAFIVAGVLDLTVYEAQPALPVKP